MKILLQNFCYGSGHSGTLSDYITRPHHLYVQAPLEPLAALAAQLREIKPDVVAVTELDLGESFRTKKHNPADLFRAFGYHTMIAAQKYDPNGLWAKTPIYKTQGNGIFSRVEPRSHAFHYLSSGIKRLVIEAGFKDGIHLFLVHLAISRVARKKQLEEIRELIKPHKHVILLGDFNTFGHPEDLEPLMRAGKLRSLNVNHEPTYPSAKPRLELDYILVSPTIRVKHFAVLPTYIADHLPLLVEIA